MTLYRTGTPRISYFFLAVDWDTHSHTCTCAQTHTHTYTRTHTNIPFCSLSPILSLSLLQFPSFSAAQSAIWPLP